MENTYLEEDDGNDHEYSEAAQDAHDVHPERDRLGR